MQSIIFKLLALVSTCLISNNSVFPAFQDIFYVITDILMQAAICLATPHGEKAEIENLGSKLMTRDDGVEMMGTFLKYRSVETGPMANLKKVSLQQSAMES